MQTTKIRTFSGFWSKKDCIARPDALFVFGDNDRRFGNKGQAVIRDCANSVGVPTKKYPSLDFFSYYNDSELSENKKKIKTAIKLIISLSKKYKTVYLPENGLGTGLADLPIRAPNTYVYLQKKIEHLKLMI